MKGMDNFSYISTKIFSSPASLQRELARQRFLGQKIVFTNGCFDILHRGHVEYLAKASSFGHFLLVGLNTDASVRRIKGASRPVNDQDSRALILAALSFVSAVCLFDEDTPYELICSIKPDFLVKGADYKPSEIVGSDLVLAGGGEVVTIPLTAGFSSTSILSKI